MEQKKDNIKVMVRVRCLNDRETEKGSTSCIKYSPNNPHQIIIDSKPEKSFTFDHIATPNHTQENIF